MQYTPTHAYYCMKFQEYPQWHNVRFSVQFLQPEWQRERVLPNKANTVLTINCSSLRRDRNVLIMEQQMFECSTHSCSLTWRSSAPTTRPLRYYDYNKSDAFVTVETYQKNNKSVIMEPVCTRKTVKSLNLSFVPGIKSAFMLLTCSLSQITQWKWTENEQHVYRDLQ